MLIDSEEIYFVDYDKDASKSLLYAPLRSYLCLVKNSLKDSVLNLEYSKEKELILGMLRKRPRIDIEELHNSILAVEPELAIEITDNCNLRCRYCHASAGEEGKESSMSLEIIDAILPKYFNSVKGKVRITFGGGEPTLDFERFSYTVNKAKGLAKDAGVIVSFRMATNGCFDEIVREYVKANFSEVSLSFDGPDFIQNVHRPFKNGRGSFNSVYKTAKDFYDSGFSFAFRATISDYSMRYLKEIIDFFSDNFPGKKLGLEPLNPLGRATRDSLLKKPDKLEFSKQILFAYRYAEQKDIELISSSVGKFQTLRTVFCNAVAIPSWTVTTRGSIMCCSRDNAPDLFQFGQISKGDTDIHLDREKINKIRLMNVFNYSECSECFCKYHCAGDCPDLRVFNLHNCAATKNIGKYILNKKIDENN